MAAGPTASRDKTQRGGIEYKCLRLEVYLKVKAEKRWRCGLCMYDHDGCFIAY